MSCNFRSILCSHLKQNKVLVQRVYCIFKQYFAIQSYAQLKRSFQRSFQDASDLNTMTILRLLAHFHETGGAQDKKHGRPFVLSVKSMLFPVFHTFSVTKTGNQSWNCHIIKFRSFRMSFLKWSFHLCFKLNAKYCLIINTLCAWKTLLFKLRTIFS